MKVGEPMSIVKNRVRFTKFIVCISIGVILGRFTTVGFLWAIVFGLITAFVMEILSQKEKS
jgi:tetrahydromethanopterin S-methyltransferase subunit G